MQNNKLRMAIRATAAVTALGLASQAQAFSFSAGDVDASVYGYARLNMAYDMNEDTGTAGGYGAFPSVNDTDEAEGHFDASAAQSRIGVKATNADGVTFNVEGDFLGGGQELRLRHAYGSYNGVLAGQTWSNYNSFVGVTSTLDFNGLIGGGGYGSRTAQLRYTTGPVSFSIEDPQSSFDSSVSDAKDGVPALTARLEDKAGSFSYAAAALVKQNAYDTGTEDDSAMAFAAFGAASVAITDMITVRGAVNYADGANSYIYISGGDDAYLDSNGDLENISGMGGTVGTSINLGNGRSINVSYSMSKLDVDDLAADTLESREAAYVNYQWTPVENVMMGVEYGYKTSENQNGDNDDANRLMFAAQYNF